MALAADVYNVSRVVMPFLYAILMVLVSRRCFNTFNGSRNRRCPDRRADGDGGCCSFSICQTHSIYIAYEARTGTGTGTIGVPIGVPMGMGMGMGMDAKTVRAHACNLLQISEGHLW